MPKYLTVKDENEVSLGYLSEAKNIEVRERLNGESLLSFSIPYQSIQTKHIALEGYVEHSGQLYVIKEIEQSSDARKSDVSVRAVHVYIELIDDYIDRTVELFGTTAQNALTEALSGTNFVVGTVEPTDLKDIDLTEMNVLKAVQAIREKWNCDLWFDNRTIYLGTKGSDNQYEIRYGKNLKTLRRPSSSSELITRLYPYGKDGLTIEGVNGGVKYVDSSNINLWTRVKSAEKRWNDISDPAELKAKAEEYLAENDSPKVSYQTDFLELEKVGVTGIGDSVTITHNPFDIKTIGTRVVELSRFPYEPRPSHATLSSFIETTIDSYVTLKRRQYEYERYANKRVKELDASQAQIESDVNDINSSITDLRNDVDSFSDDGKLTRAEANSLEFTLYELQKESSDIISTATNLGISTEKTNYEGALSSLDNELSGNWINQPSYPIAITSTNRSTIKTKLEDVNNTKSILVNKIMAVREGNAVSDSNDYTDTQINEVNTSITNLQSDVAEFSDDNKLTLAEANSLENSLSQVDKESDDLILVADNLGITTEKTNYSSAINDLTTYLSSFTNQSSYPINITATERTNIKTKFENVQSTKSTLINAIADERRKQAQQYADDNYAAVKTNFNTRNDRISTTPANPTIPGSGVAIDHSINDDGSADISFEWGFGGTGNAYNIDGFIIYVHNSSSSSAYGFGTSPASEQVFYTSAGRRAFILYGVPANRYYTFGVQAYRIVDEDVNSSGRLYSSIIKSTNAGENPYRPSSQVAFAGNVTGTVSGVAADSINKSPTTFIIADADTSNNPKRADYVVPSGSYAQATLQDAINALPSSGGKIVLLDGTFDISNSVSVPNNVSIEGQGKSTIFKISNFANFGLGNEEYLFTNSGTRDIDFSKFVVDSTSETSYEPTAVYLNGVTDCSVRNVTTKNTYNGVKFKNSSKSEVASCKFLNNSRHGIEFEGCNDSTILTNYSDGTTYSGIGVTGNNNTVTGNLVYNTQLEGIGIYGNSNTVSSNISKNNGGGGIYLYSGKKNSITGNDCTYNETGISLLYNANNNTITGNNVNNNTANGVTLNDSSDNTISGNSIEANSTASHLADDNMVIRGNSDKNNIQGNTLRVGSNANKPRYGIRVNSTDSHYNVITNNDLRNSGSSGSFSDAGTGTVTSSGNKY